MFSIEKSPLIRDRRDFGAFANFHGYNEALEIGVYLGEFAFDFLRTWRGFTLALCDPYERYGEMPWDRTPDMVQATTRLAQFGERAKFHRMKSVDLAKFWHWRLDFCYIDGCHTYESVRADLEAWWPHVSSGGCLAGHDWCDEHAPVVKAVTEFAQKNDTTIHITADAHTNPSWYLMKC